MEDNGIIAAQQIIKSQAKYMLLALGLFWVILCLLAYTFLWGSARKEPIITCADFLTQAAAQDTFDSDPKKYKSLDANKNGIPCESLK